MTNKQHKEMWEEIAEAFWTLGNRRNEKQELMASWGICKALEFFSIKPFTGRRMFGYMKDWGEERFLNVSSLWRLSPTTKTPRGDLAYLFSTMIVKEFEGIVGYKYNGDKI